MTVQRQPIDAVTVEVIRNGLLAITEEMKTNLTRTAYNTIIYEALDFTVGLFTREGDTISIGLGLPMFIRGMSETVRAKVRHFGLDNIKPGDILVTNDAYITGSHLNHITLVVPIFDSKTLVGFAGCMAHWADIGGSVPGSFDVNAGEHFEDRLHPFARLGPGILCQIDRAHESERDGDDHGYDCADEDRAPEQRDRAERSAGVLLGDDLRAPVGAEQEIRDPP